MTERRRLVAERQPGECVGPYRILSQLGEGTFSKVYLAEKAEPAAEGGEEQKLALKLFKDRGGSKAQFQSERDALAFLQKVSCICQLVEVDNQNSDYMVFKLLGDNLGNLRKQAREGRFSWSTTSAIGVKMLRCIEAVHAQGYVHRDIKPGNFLIGVGTDSREVFLIDFGLAKPYRRDGAHVAQRLSTQEHTAKDFRGSAKYASHHTHNGEDVGRRDDLWCWFYSLVLFREGVLPWDGDRDNGTVAQKKVHCLERPEDLTWHPRLQVIQSYLKGLSFDSDPDYGFLARVLELEGPFTSEPYDWEKGPSHSQQSPKGSSGLKRPREDDVLGGSLGARAVELERATWTGLQQRLLELHDAERVALLMRFAQDLCDKAKGPDPHVAERFKRILGDLKAYFSELQASI